MCIPPFFGFIPQGAIVIEPAELIERGIDPGAVRQTMLWDQRIMGKINAHEPSIFVIDEIQLDAEGASIEAPNHPAADRIRLIVDHPHAALLLLDGRAALR